MDWLIVVGIVLIVAAIIAASIWFERKRIDALRLAASNLGLELETGDDRELGRKLRFLNLLNRGDRHTASNVLRGTVDQEPILACEYRYETRSTDSKGRTRKTDHHFHVYTVTLDREVPELLISPEGLFSKFAQAFGYDDIDFESAEFSRRFCVRSKDKRFAYDFCDARMIEFLLSRPRLQVEAEGQTLATIYQGKFAPDRIVAELGDLLEIRRRIPTHLAV